MSRSISSFFFPSRRRHTRFDCDWSSDVCSPDLGTARPPARPADGRLGVKVARPAATTDPDVSASPSPPPLPALPPAPGRPRPAPRALVGVTCSLLTAAIRRAEERWVSDHADDDDPDGIPRVLAAIGLAAGRRGPADPPPPPPPPPPPRP